MKKIVLVLFFTFLLFPSKVLAGTTPVGWIDSVSIVDNKLKIVGWAVDPDNPDASIDVHFYVDGPAGSGTGLGTTTANIPRVLPYPGNHHYLWVGEIPERFQDGKYHQVFAHGIDVTGDANAILQPDGSDPKTPVRTFIYPKTKFGILYSLWHCPVVDNLRTLVIPNVERILKGEQSWAPIPEFHYWDEPVLGYYCLKRDTQVLRQHAIWLHDAGVDFVIIDSTNQPNVDNLILDPLQTMLEVWSQVDGAPKIVPWAPLPQSGTMYNAIINKMNQFPNMYFEYLGKPLLAISDNYLPIDNTKLNNLKNQFTTKMMWGYLAESNEKWSFLEPCENFDAFRESQATLICNQRSSLYEGKIEQVSIGMAFQLPFMSDKRSAVPKFQGRTFRKQFETLFNNPESLIATITGWNEWIAQRLCLNTEGGASSINCKNSNDHFPDGSKVFVDSYSKEYNRDIEPAKDDMGDYYYRLMKACITLYKSGNRCDSNHAENLCCRDFRSSDILLSGDLNSDSKVDISDLRYFLTKFLNPYTIFDYNKIVENFGN